MMMMCTGHHQLTIPPFPLLHGLLRNPISTEYLPKWPPYTAFLGNLPYDVAEDSIKDFFRGLNIGTLCIPHEPSNPDRLKGFCYAEFEDLDSLLSALSLNEESLGNRKIRMDVSDQALDKDRENHSFGQDRNWDSDKTDTEWRAHPATDSFDDYPPRRGDDSFGDKHKDRYSSDWYQNGYNDGHPDSPHRDMDHYGGRDPYDGRGSRDYYSKIGSGRRTFGSGYQRDDDCRRGGDHYEDRYDRQDDWLWSFRDDLSMTASEYS